MNLERTYRSLIRIYPMDYRFRFEGEMLKTFELAIEEHRQSGASGFARFALVEFVGCIRGAGTEWIAKFITDVSVRRRYLPDPRMMHLPWIPREPRYPSVRRIRCSSDTSR